MKKPGRHRKDFGDGAAYWWYEPSQKMCEEFECDIAFGDGEDFLICNPL